MCLNIIDGRGFVRSARRALLDALALLLGFSLAAGVATNGSECCSPAPEASELEGGR